MRIFPITKINREPDRQPDEDGSMDMLLRLKSEGAYKPIYPRIHSHDATIIRAHTIAQSMKQVLSSDDQTQPLLLRGLRKCLRKVLKKRHSKNGHQQENGMAFGIADFHD